MSVEIKACLVDADGRAVSSVQTVEMVGRFEQSPSVFKGFDLLTTRLENFEPITFDMAAGSVVRGVAVALGTFTCTTLVERAVYGQDGTYVLQDLTLVNSELVELTMKGNEPAFTIYDEAPESFLTLRNIGKSGGRHNHLDEKERGV